MRTDQFENKTKEYFFSKGIKLVKIVETNDKTPDFENHEVLVEVKNIKPQELEGLYPDSTYNNIKSNLKDAARKFRDHDSHHQRNHIVVIFSKNILKDDIYSVWTGKVAPSIPERIFRGGMILPDEHRKCIDEIIWFEKISDLSPKHVYK